MSICLVLNHQLDATGMLSEQKVKKNIAATRDRTGGLKIFSLTLSQLSYRGLLLGFGGNSAISIPLLGVRNIFSTHCQQLPTQTHPALDPGAQLAN